MFCTTCGKQISNDSIFCPYCGSTVSIMANSTSASNKNNSQMPKGIRPTPALPPLNNPYFQSSRTAKTEKYDFSNTSAKKALQQSYGSVLFLIAVISFTLNAMISLLSMVIPSIGSIALVAQILNYFDSSYYSIPGLSFIAGSTILISLLTILPDVIMCIGVWIAWFSSKNRNSKLSVGFLLLQIMTYVTYIPTLLVMAIVIIGLISWISRLSFGVMIIFLLVIIAIAIFTYMFLLSSEYASRKTVVRSGSGWRDISTVLIVVNTIIICYTLITMFPIQSILSFSSNSSTGAIIQKFFKATYLLFFTITLIRAKSAYAKIIANEN